MAYRGDDLVGGKIGPFGERRMGPPGLWDVDVYARDTSDVDSSDRISLTRSNLLGVGPADEVDQVTGP